MAKPAVKVVPAVVATGSQTGRNGNSNIPNAGWKWASVPMSVSPRVKPWIKPWNGQHPTNNAI